MTKFIISLSVSLVCAFMLGLLIGEKTALRNDTEWQTIAQDAIDVAEAWQAKYNTLADSTIAHYKRSNARYDSLAK